MDNGAPRGTKWCRVCKAFHDEDAFTFKYRDRGIRHGLCRVAQREVSRMYYQRDPAPYKARAKAGRQRARVRNREKFREYLNASWCADCGIRDFAVLEFDHRDPGDKHYDISSVARGPNSWATVLKEIAKCDVVCANCHRKRTARQFGWRRLFGLEKLVLPPLPKRGTPDYERIKWTRSRLARQHRNRTCIYQYLREHPCVLCGEDDPVVPDFDHVRDKVREVTVIAAFGGMVDLLAEIKKCRVLCANCHRRHTAQLAGRLR